ncbi:MAG TPA: hypothetical protein DCY35_09980 [Prolixibacteraceae bacterium]|nr:hypothetical protein [Prolixibacteraceae bacterium]
MLVRIVKNWTAPDLFRQTPDSKGIWDDIHFTFDPVDECDGLLVLNVLKEDITVRCPPENIWAIFQEPYLPDFLPWMKDGHEQFARVYTHRPPTMDPRYHPAPPLVPWHVGMSYDELLHVHHMPKNDSIVWVTSALQVLPGHVKRYGFYQFLKEKGWSDLNICGRGIRQIKDKWDVLDRCRYAIAVENHCGDNYWTEKIADCWLSETLPFYYGCPNLENFFPADSFVRIDLDDFDSAASVIRRVVDSGEYEKRLPAIREARKLVLNQFQFFPFMAKEMQNGFRRASLVPVHLSSFRQGPLDRLRNHCNQMLHLYKARNFS